MTILPGHFEKVLSVGPSNTRHNERGAALAIALMMMVLLSAVALGVLAVVQGEAKIAGSDLKRTEACYASAAAMEIMTNKFSTLFAHTSRPSDAEIKDIADTRPVELTNPTDPNSIAYTFPDHKLGKNTVAIQAMGTNTTRTIPYGPFNGLLAGLTPYKMTTTAQSSLAQCKLTRDMNNYLIPLFQFGMFSDKDIELHPGVNFTFNGRIHANGNIYANGKVKFLDKVTTASEFVYDVLRNGDVRPASGINVSMKVGAIDVLINKGSATNGPNFLAAGCAVELRGCFPGSPNGTINSSWNTTSVAAAVAGQNNKLGGQLLTRSTGAAQLKLPLQLDGNPTRELIKRTRSNDSPDPANPTALRESRYHSKAEIRILIDDENPSSTDDSGIPAGQGVTLSTWDPVSLPAVTALTPISAVYTANGGGRALWKINDNNTLFLNSYQQATNPIVQQWQQTGAARQADTVRSLRGAPAARAITVVTKSSNGNPISITSLGHGFATGDLVVVSGVPVGAPAATLMANNTAARTYWPITRVDANTFTLDGSAPTGTTGTYTGPASAYKLAQSASGTLIPYGAGITGRILIEIVDAAGNVNDVTQQILSMGMTEGEPNSIVQLQRPLWGAFTQGSRDASGGTNTLTSMANSTTSSNSSDGEILIDNNLGGRPLLSAANYLTSIMDDDAVNTVRRLDIPQSNAIATLMTGNAGPNWQNWNAIVPINMYNVREGHLKTTVNQDFVYERGITSIVQLNMKNLARWIDGVFDANLLAGTSAVSTNIASPDGYIVYVSDRRGDKVKTVSGGLTSTNGMVDNLDIYGPNNEMDAGEDVQNSGVLEGNSLSAAGLKDTTELPDPVALAGTYGANDTRRAIAVAAWSNLDAVPTNHRYFRSAVRLFNGETLQVLSAARRLSTIEGITVSSENMVYIWGNYNTTGINQSPAAGVSSLNDRDSSGVSTSPSHYCPGAGPALSAACASLIDTQVPASIVADSFFPMSKTWFDSNSAVNTDDYQNRPADAGLPNVQAETAVRAGIIAGNNLAAIADTPDADNDDDSRLNGGMHNFPRFLEDWLAAGRRWNFVGSFVPLYNSTQAVGQWWYVTNDRSLYGAPVRNWSFDKTFLQMDKLPPGTPMFQYISPSAFRQEL